MGGNRRALVVDDDPQVLSLITRWLEDAGYDVSTTVSFADAKLRIESDKPDALVVDVRLEAFNGIQLAVRARAERFDTRIAIVSGFDDPVLRREAMACAAAFLVKPLNRDELLQAIGAGELPDAPA
jgi:DNA-binding response OmpR family regulator